MKFEVCASTFESAINAQLAGADRIELCEQLEVGGLTPSRELLEHVLQKVELPVFVLIRPREGEFNYSSEEFELMIQSIEEVKTIGGHGIVSGVLTAEHELDIERTQILVEKASPLPFTFHRAFDEIKQPIKSVQQIKNMGVRRLLSSGQQPTAKRGLQLLNELKEFEDTDFNILPGGGITPNNAKLFKSMGFKEIHASGIRHDKKEINDYADGFKDFQYSSKRGHSDLQILKEILQIVRD